jgi:NaMN:DMB phosphoribosyltransferase
LKPLLDFELDEPGVGAGVAAGIVKAAALTASGLATAISQGAKSA